MSDIDPEKTIRFFIINIFNEILKDEELIVTRPFKKLSLREVHVIEAVCEAEENNQDNSATAIANALDITGGTLTTAVNSLEKKGYLCRKRDSRDKRIVRIVPTSEGRKVQKYHMLYHKHMVDDILYILDEEETAVLIKALGSLATFFKAKRAHRQITVTELLDELDKANDTYN